MVPESSVMAVIRASRPSFRNPHDKIAFALHASFIAAGFSLIARGKTVSCDNPQIGEEEVGIEGWNELDDSYAFLYSKSEKGQKQRVLVKCLAIGDMLMIDALNLEEGDKEPINLQINVMDYVSDYGNKTNNYGDLYKNFKGLVEAINTGVLEKLEPKAEPKVGSSTSARGGKRSGHSPDPATEVPIERQPHPPIGTEPFTGVPLEPEPYHPGYHPGLVYPPVPPFGGSDLEPWPGAGIYPARGPGIGGGMIVGPDDPRWFGDFVRPRGPIGGIPGLPPGARFDPYGPPDVPGFEPSRFVRQPRPPGSGTHPDLEHFQGPDYI